MKTICLFVAFMVAAFAQDSGTVNVSQGPPQRGFSQHFFYDAGGRVEYVCYAESSAKLATFVVTAATNATPIVVTTDVAHGLADGAVVTIFNGLGNTAVNGSFQVAVASSTTLQLKNRTTGANIAGNGTYSASTAVLQTSAPRTNEPIWAIQKYIYNGSGVLQRIVWIEGTTTANSTSATGKVCDNRANYGAQ